MSRAINVNMKANTRDFRRIEQRIAQVLADTKVEGLSKEEQAEREKRFQSTLGHYTGPVTGLVWNDETGKISIAAGWHADADGNVVRD
jgi:hypothetical protein